MREPRYVRWIAAVGVVVALAACAADPTPTTTAVSVRLVASQDATLYDSGEEVLANGAGEYLFVGTTGQPQARRSLVAFDVAGGIPAGATILGAELTLEMSRTGLPLFENRIALHRVNASWGEGTSDPTLNEGRGDDALPGDATWVHRTYADTRWATPGGDFAASASATIGVARLGPYTWGPTEAMVADVQAWLDDASSNHGWALVGNEVERRGVKRFDSRERTEEAVRPVLTVVYAPA